MKWRRSLWVPVDEYWDKEVVYCTTFNKHFLERKCAVHVSDDSDWLVSGEGCVAFKLCYLNNLFWNQRQTFKGNYFMDLEKFWFYSKIIYWEYFLGLCGSLHGFQISLYLLLFFIILISWERQGIFIIPSPSF